MPIFSSGVSSNHRDPAGRVRDEAESVLKATVAIGVDGLPVVSYYAEANDDLKVARVPKI